MATKEEYKTCKYFSNTPMFFLHGTSTDLLRESLDKDGCFPGKDWTLCTTGEAEEAMAYALSTPAFNLVDTKTYRKKDESKISDVKLNGSVLIIPITDAVLERLDLEDFRNSEDSNIPSVYPGEFSEYKLAIPDKFKKIFYSSESELENLARKGVDVTGMIRDLVKYTDYHCGEIKKIVKKMNPNEEIEPQSEATLGYMAVRELINPNFIRNHFEKKEYSPSLYV